MTGSRSYALCVMVSMIGCASDVEVEGPQIAHAEEPLSSFRGAGVPKGTHGASGLSVQLLDSRVLFIPEYVDADRIGQIYTPNPSTWKQVPGPSTRRLYASAATMSDGRVLLAGGEVAKAPSSSAEIFDPETETWIAAPSMLGAHQNGRAFALKGKVMVVGGGTFPTCDLFDEKTSTWSACPKPKNAYSPLGLLADGRVLSAKVSTSEIYDVGTNTWSPAANTSASYSGGTLTLLADGRTLLTGGETTAEIYDPGKNTWTPAAAPLPRTSTSLTLLKNGRVLMVGGWDDSYKPRNNVQLYEPTADKWIDWQPLSVGLSGHDAHLLPDGEVLISGGISEGSDGSTVITRPQLFRLETGTECTTDVQCASDACTDGVCCDKRCLGACETCTGKTKGTCSPSDSAPEKGHASCGSYNVCKAGACATSCESDSDCAAGSQCYPETKTCGVEKPRCDGDHTVTPKTGAPRDCSPYRCAPAGDCRTDCAKSDECTGGFICSSGICISPAVTGEPPSSSCVASGTPASLPRSIAIGFALLGLLGLVRRARR